MRTVTRAVRVVALTVALGTVAATSGAGVASAWWEANPDNNLIVKDPRVPEIGVGIPDDGVAIYPRFGDSNPGYRGISSNSLPDQLKMSEHVNGVDSAIKYSRQFSDALDPRQNSDVPPGSAAAAKTAATAKPGPSRTTKPGPARATKFGPSRTTNSRGR
jgi:hypothetical protein